MSSSIAKPPHRPIEIAISRRAGSVASAVVGISETQLSLFRSGKVRGIRFATVAAMCAVLECKPGDLLDYDVDAADLERAEGGPD